MKAEIEAVVNIQRLDDRAAELQKEIDALPKHVAEIERKLDSHIRQLESDRTALAANLKARKQHEDEIKVQEQKISKLKDQMLQAKTNEQYHAFQKEIGYHEGEIRKAEDKILDLMGAAESLEIAVKAAEKSLAEEKKSVEGEKEHARKRTAEDKEALARIQTERQQSAASVDAKLLADYERLRKKHRGAAISEATDGRCSVCHMALRPQHFQDLRRRDQVLHCESCGRILFYNPPVDVSAEMQQA